MSESVKMYNRKSIWKLLDSLSKNYQSEPDEDFYDFIEDILCKDPKLIHSSAKALNDHLQDDFIEWLIIKLLQQVSSSKTTSVDKSVCFQKKVLTACSAHRTILFRRLLNIYRNFIDDITSCLRARLTQQDAEGERILKSTKYSLTLDEESSAVLLQLLCEILSYALQIDPGIGTSRLHDEVPYILKILQIGHFQAKVKCFIYFSKLLSLAHLNDVDIALYAGIALSALVQTSELKVFWLNVKAIDWADISELAEIGTKLLSQIIVLVEKKKLRNTPKLLSDICKLLVFEVRMQRESVSSSRKHKAEEFMEICGILLKLALERDWFHFATLERSHPDVLDYLRVDALYKHRALVAFVFSEVENLSTARRDILSRYLAANLMAAFEKETVDYKNLRLLLQATWLLEYQNAISNNAVSNVKAEALKNFTQSMCKNFESKETPVVDKKSILILLAMVLQIAALRNLLQHSDEEQMLKTIEAPLQDALASQPANRNAKEDLDPEQRLLCILSFEILCKLHPKNAASLEATLAGVLDCYAKKILRHQMPQSRKSLADSLRNIFKENLRFLLTAGRVTHKTIFTECMQKPPADCGALHMSVVLEAYLCSLKSEAYLVQHSAASEQDDSLWNFASICSECASSSNSNQKHAVSIKLSLIARSDCPSTSPLTLAHIKADIKSALRANSRHYDFLHNHLEMTCPISTPECLELLSSAATTAADPQHNMLLLALLSKSVVNRNDGQLHRHLCTFLLARIRRSLDIEDRSRKKPQQMHLLDLMRWLLTRQVKSFEEKWLLSYFKLTCIYLVHPASAVRNEAIIFAQEMCAAHNTEPITLWNLYKRSVQDYIVPLVVFSYLHKGLRLNRSIRNFSQMLGYTCVQEFIYRNHRLMLSTLLPYCLRSSECKGIVLCMSKITKKSIAALLISSFRRIYCHVHLYETESMRSSCINYVTKTTNLTKRNLLNVNVKQTVAELLTYFNRMPNFVMEAFQYLINGRADAHHSSLQQQQQPTRQKITKIAMKQFCEFISERFLGILTYFETMLRDSAMEKSLKRDAFCSLGQIIRFVDAEQHITKHRFKITAMLDSAYALNDESLMKICMAVWRVFLEHVKLQESDASLSHIAALLYPLLEKNGQDVNKIYEDIVLKNTKHLQPSALMDLYFLKDNRNVKESIRRRILNESKMLSDEATPLLDQIGFFFKQMSSESSHVRTLALKHLSTFFLKQRASMNRLVLHEMRDDDMLLEKVTNVLITSCSQDDRELQLAAARCLGELGAIDPGYMPFNNHFESKISDICLSVHTDSFAIMALTELCRSYQFQNDGSHNDNFSLAIQETLSICGISPKDKKKTNVWEAIPEHMREIMLPLLTSCYTMTRRERVCKEHPIYNSGCYRNFSEWAFLFAVRLIGYVRDENTKRLLTCYKPSIKRNSTILGTFFPYILLHSLQDCSESELQLIFEEFDAVFRTRRRDFLQQHQQQQEHRRQGQKEYSLKCFFNRQANEGGQGSLVQRLDHQMLTNSAEDIVRCCIKHCSEQVSFLQRWLHEWEQTNSKLMTQSANSKAQSDYRKVKSFVAKFDKRHVAQANHESGEYAQALLCLEEFVESEKQIQLQDELSFLIEIYCGLGDTDSVEGALYLKKTNLSLFENILVNQITGQNHASIICYEQLLSRNIEAKLNPDFIKGMINCYVALETPETALLIANGLWQAFTQEFSEDCFAEGQLEALWRLGRYEELEEAFKSSSSEQRHHSVDAKNCWSIHCAEALMLFKSLPSGSERQGGIARPNSDAFLEKLNILRLSSIQSNLSYAVASEQKAYAYFYDDVVKLHLLTEVEKMKLLLCDVWTRLQAQAREHEDKKSLLTDVAVFFQEMDARMRVLKPTVHVVESVLCFRRNLFTEAKRWLEDCGHLDSLSGELASLFSKEIGKLWLLSSQKHKDVGNLEQAYAALVKAEHYSPEPLFIEKSKLLWKKGSQTAALKLLDENIALFDGRCSSNPKNLSSNERLLYAEAKFLQATFNAEAKNICCELNIKYYSDAITANKQSEKYYVRFAQYMEQIYERYSPAQRHSEYGCKIILDIMLSYAKSLRWGHENVYQSLPRLLSLWLDYTSEAKSLDTAASASGSASQSVFVSDTARKMNDLLSNCTSLFPAAVLYTAVSQILSRICHLSEDVFNIIRTIVIKLLDNFPQQTLWLILPVLKSSYVTRIKRCKLILSDSRLAGSHFQKLIVDFNMLSERLIELANKEVALDRNYELGSLVKQLPRLFADSRFSKILLPFEKHMQVIFPITSSSSAWSDAISLDSGQKKSSGDLSKPTNRFPYKPVFIIGINDEITVLRSAAKPKKISFQCDDGNQYAVMVKPKDDLRRDFRLMEFNALVKRYLHLDSNARHRRLHIRTYAVIPFNEECGLVEWLPNLVSFRNICTSIYRKLGLGLLDKSLRQYALPVEASLDQKRSIFNGVLLKNHPPVFHLWFRRRFVSPHAWYEARSSYVKTVAVMSIVGYILGLGDRHGENLLFDETNGEAVHVDFNCLFNQGELFAFPELVPFRLTHNMTFAMGPLGVEGLYRKCCEITLRVLKQQSETLMSVLRPFVYDLVVFNRNAESKQLHRGGELTDPKAVNDVRRISQRLQGHVRKAVSDSMPLSPEGQVNFLINESTSIDNLAAMYIGWGAYL